MAAKIAKTPQPALRKKSTSLLELANLIAKKGRGTQAHPPLALLAPPAVAAVHHNTMWVGGEGRGLSLDIEDVLDDMSVSSGAPRACPRLGWDRCGALVLGQWRPGRGKGQGDGARSG